MTLTELKYVIAVAGELHFGHAATKCFVSQPTLSVAIKKLEDELGIIIFERHKHDVTITPLGKKIVAQAQMVIDQANTIKLIANEALDPYKTRLQLGIIYTIGPYLLPKLIPVIHQSAPELSLIIDEDFTVNLTDKLKRGDLDMIIVSTPFKEKGIITELLYKEPLIVALPKGHSLCCKKTIKADDLLSETLLLLKTGNCFRDQVMDVCPACKGELFSKAKIQQTLEGSSLETIRQMVATGSGVTILPGSSVPNPIEKNSLVEYRPFSRPVPKREVILAYRDTYPGKKLIKLISETINNCELAST
ncbi:MAG: LysR family hydrogen peroxide-inducible transcriptional activator [Gammaproteobacteria bacterium]|jgi:LysR family hydrogen peroxide-inducible transcriptional activator